MSVEIYVASHRQVNIELPSCYKLVQVNAKKRGELWKGFIHDDSGENISEKNESYCELTAVYWGWKNSSAEIKGLNHYRRYFSANENPILTGSKAISTQMIKDLCLQEDRMIADLSEYDIILQMPYIPYPSTAGEDLTKYCYEKDVEKLTEVIREKFPEYENAYFSVMQGKNLSYCNMLIAKREIFDAYCEWLFSVLEAVEERCDISNYDPQHKRLFGYLAEVLLNVYVQKHQLKAKYYTPLYVESFDKKETSLKHMIHAGNVALFNVLEKTNVKLLEFVASKYKKAMYDRYLHCKQYLEQKD